MKKTIFFTSLFLLSILAKAQYFFGYAVSSSQMKVYHIAPVNIKEFSNCKDESKKQLDPKECMLNALKNTIKIYDKSNYSSYQFTAVVDKTVSAQPTVGDKTKGQYFPSFDEALIEWLKMTKEYSDMGYTVKSWR